MSARYVGAHYARYGLALSLPSVVGRQGVAETFLPEMSDDETHALERSAATLRGAVGKYLHKS
jgi:L-lactate dehydrogenase